jgi:ABC-type lipoprotein export system ATPase subunit
MLTCQSLSKHYRSSKGVVKSLDQIDLHVSKGEFLVVRGHSGSGKTTLLLTLGAMLNPTHGKVVFNDSDLYGLSRAQRARVRSKSIGFVFQMFHLVPYLNVIDNVLTGDSGKHSMKHTQNLNHCFGNLGSSIHLHHLPNQLSAGEKQRTALARAMVANPDLILADEPTGNLDPENSKEVCRHLKSYQEKGGTVIVVTHGDALNEFANRTIDLKAGKMISNPSVDR